MTGEFTYKSCRICGGDITIDDQICPLCSSRQKPGKRLSPTGLNITLAGLGFFGIMLLGIMSAHAIQQIICSRTNDCNVAAVKNVKAAKTGLDRYFAQNGQFPETLGQIFFKPDNDVTVALNKTAGRSYRLVSFHAQGDKEYLAVSGKAEIYFKGRNQPGSQYFPLK
ncbi:MAG: hypothetical protein EHM79_17555 [Geobacter sp.]|nr:MAG: hypothetical protein EHM79_17555 [Geobacter sp.]